MQTEFVEKLKRIQVANQTGLVLKISLQMVQMPLPMKQHDDPFFPFGRAIIAATQDLVCGYMFDVWDYLAIGAAGAIALERTVNYARSESVTILNGRFAGVGYAMLTDETAFNADAVTLANASDLSAYHQRPDREAFVWQSGIDRVELPLDIAVYYIDRDELTVPEGGKQTITLRVLGEDALYAGHGEDYAEHTRKVVEQGRARSIGG